ncbi:phage tail sheath family protein, partial [Streptomyces sp. NPDC013489]
MPTYLSPGVYVEEVASGSRPIEGLGTSVAAFVGLAPAGPLNEPVLVTNWSQYVASFGDFADGYYLAHSVYGFFNNGGTAAYVVRVGGGDAQGATRAVGSA